VQELKLSFNGDKKMKKAKKVKKIKKVKKGELKKVKGGRINDDQTQAKYAFIK